MWRTDSDVKPRRLALLGYSRTNAHNQNQWQTSARISYYDGEIIIEQVQLFEILQ
jgi:hypothetical protein